MYDKILLPTDGSALANKAVRHGITLAMVMQNAGAGTVGDQNPRAQLFHGSLTVYGCK